MGVHLADSDSETLVEKPQSTTAHKRSYCPFVVLRKLCREHREKREQQYRPKIDEIRGQANETRKKVELCLKGPWHGTTSTEQRRVLWERGLDSVSLKRFGLRLNKSLRYKVTTSDPITKSVTIVIHDLRTPQGREEAFKWWDKVHLRNESAATGILTHYDRWDKIFQEYINQHHVYQRVFLLRGPDRVIWLETKVEELPS